MFLCVNQLRHVNLLSFVGDKNAEDDSLETIIDADKDGDGKINYSGKTGTVNVHIIFYNLAICNKHTYQFSFYLFEHFCNTLI